MEPQTFTALISAGAAILGGVVVQLGSIFRSASDKREAEKALMRSRLEELLDNVHQTTEWMNLVLDRHSPKLSSSCDESVRLSVSARRVYVLALLYFPALKNDAKNFLDSTYGFYRVVTSAVPQEQESIIEISEAFKAAKANMDSLAVIEAEKLI